MFFMSLIDLSRPLFFLHYKFHAICLNMYIIEPLYYFKQAYKYCLCQILKRKKYYYFIKIIEINLLKN